MVLWGRLVGLVRSRSGVGVVFGVGLFFRGLVLVVVLWVRLLRGCFLLGFLVGSVFRCLRVVFRVFFFVVVVFGFVFFGVVFFWFVLNCGKRSRGGND